MLRQHGLAELRIWRFRARGFEFGVEGFRAFHRSEEQELAELRIEEFGHRVKDGGFSLWGLEKG